MNKLSTKIIFILLPLAACLIGFGYAYYKAKEKLTIDHIFRSSQLSALLGANEISHYIDGRATEFNQLSGAISYCYNHRQSISELASDALSFTSGFSALIISDTNGKLIDFQLAKNRKHPLSFDEEKSRHIQVLAHDKIQRLNESFNDWLYKQAQHTNTTNNTVTKQSSTVWKSSRRNGSDTPLKRGDIEALPQQIIYLAPKEVSNQLGLTFNKETYFYSRPLIDCNQRLLGYYTAVLDRTLIEQQLTGIKQSLIKNGHKYVDVFVVRNDDLAPLSESNYINLKQLQLNGFNPTNNPLFRSDLGGIMINQPIGMEIYKHLVFFDDLDLQSDERGVTLVVFISDKELEYSNAELLREVLLYLGVGLILFVSLTGYLARHIAAPILELRLKISSLARAGKVDTNFTERKDEIGELFDAFSDMASNIKRKETQLTRLALEDPLTGILNRRALVNSAIAAQNKNALSSVCMMDLDHFKQINDECGHAIGDNVLIAFCNIVSEHTRESDIFGRLGGEEFGLVLPGTQLDEAYAIAEKIREKIEQKLSDSLCSSHYLQATVSIGVIEWQDNDINQALAKADKLLYKAKQNGRNRVEL